MQLLNQKIVPKNFNSENNIKKIINYLLNF